MKPTRAAARRYLPASPFNVPAKPAPPVEQYAVHDQVTHDKYGLGVVVSIDDDNVVLVDFGTAQARIASPYPKLVKL
jgi:hypothetical protein